MKLPEAPSAAEPATDPTRGQFGDAMEYSAIGTALVSLEGQWLRTNRALHEMLGYSAEEFLQITFQDITHAEDLEEDLAQVGRLIAGDIAAYQMEKRYIRKDGSEVWGLLSVSLVRNACGAPQYFISQVQDISDRKAEELEKEILTQRLIMATRAGRVGIWDWDIASARVIANERMLEIYGLPEGAPADQPLYFKAVHPDDEIRVAAELKAATTGAAPFNTEFRIIRPDGAVRHIKALATLVRDAEGQPVRLVGTNCDVTEARELSLQAQAASEAQARFLACMSHEIRTPLNGVLGMAQAMTAEPLSETQAFRLDVIRDSGESLLTILNDILDLSKVESGQLTIEEVDFDLGRMLGAVHATFGSIAEAKELKFTLDLGDAAGTYRGDPTRVRQVIANLVSNALKFTAEGEVKIAASLTDDGLAVKISDTGAGISAEAQKTIFDKFTQADASITRTHGGTGLGLSISRELATLMGGDITLDSRLAAGSTFTVRLPLYPTGEAVAADAAQPMMDAPRGELRLLVAEDNPTNQLVIKALLGQLGIAPTVVANGREAVEAWRSGDWDAILMDMQMPVMDGVAATCAIRDAEERDKLPRTPIIALTANAMAHHVAEYARVGMDAFVQKPIDVRTLFAALEQVIEPDAAQDDAEPALAAAG